MSSSPRLQLSTRDPDEAHQRLTEIYCPHSQTVLSGHDGFRASQKTSGCPGVDLDELDYGRGEILVESAPFEHFILVSRPVGGPFAVRSDAGEIARVNRRTVVMDPYSSYTMHWGRGCHLLNVRLSRERVERTVADIKGLETPVRVRFGLGGPGPAAAASWDAVAQSLWQYIVPSGIAKASPLVSAQVQRLAVAALLEAFPNSMTAVEPVDQDFVAPAAVRRAVAFIEQCAADDIGLRDIARAARVSPRALQAAFRRHKDTTPLRYLRETRLHRAHDELREADVDSGVTVSDVAYRWGFGNLGRFAEDFRKVFGTTPSQVLRRD